MSGEDLDYYLPLSPEAERLGDEHGIDPYDVEVLLRYLWYIGSSEPLNKPARRRLRSQAAALRRAGELAKSIEEEFLMPSPARWALQRSGGDPFLSLFGSFQSFADSATELADLAERVAATGGPPGSRVHPHQIWMANEARRVWRRHHPKVSDRANWQSGDFIGEVANAPANAYTAWMVDVLGTVGMLNEPGENRVRTVLRYLENDS